MPLCITLSFYTQRKKRFSILHCQGGNYRQIACRYTLKLTLAIYKCVSQDYVNKYKKESNFVWLCRASSLSWLSCFTWFGMFLCDSRPKAIPLSSSKTVTEMFHTLAWLSAHCVLHGPCATPCPENRPVCRGACPCSGALCGPPSLPLAPCCGTHGWSVPPGSGSPGLSQRNSRWGCPRTAWSLDHPGCWPTQLYC